MNEDELNEIYLKYNIKIGDYVKCKHITQNFNPHFIRDIHQFEIGKITDIFISNKGYQNEAMYCAVLYEHIPELSSNHLKSESFESSIEINKLRKVSKKEYDNWHIHKKVKEYNL